MSTYLYFRQKGAPPKLVFVISNMLMLAVIPLRVLMLEAEE